MTRSGSILQVESGGFADVLYVEGVGWEWGNQEDPRVSGLSEDERREVRSAEAGRLWVGQAQELATCHFHQQ